MNFVYTRIYNYYSYKLYELIIFIKSSEFKDLNFFHLNVGLIQREKNISFKNIIVLSFLFIIFIFFPYFSLLNSTNNFLFSNEKNGRWQKKN